jgi:SAM-dependent methyltransferase
MLIVDPETAAREIRRVLRTGGAAAIAVWDEPGANPWATIPNRALIELGHAQPPDPDAPGMFGLAAPGRLVELLRDAGFTDVAVHAVAMERRYATLDRFIEETVDMSPMFSGVFAQLGAAEQAAVLDHITAAAAAFQAPDGSVALPGSALVASAGA